MSNFKKTKDKPEYMLRIIDDNNYLNILKVDETEKHFVLYLNNMHVESTEKSVSTIDQFLSTIEMHSLELMKAVKKLNETIE